MNAKEIKTSIQRAWNTREKVRIQAPYPGESSRIIYRGYDEQRNLIIEMIQNADTGVIETAYPIR
jgi:hypothetical protein